MRHAGREPAIALRDQEEVPILDDESLRKICDGAEWAGHRGELMKVAMLAPPWIPIPPPGYGGIEQVIALLAAELTKRGNEVTLFAAPGTEAPAQVLSPLEAPHPDEIEVSLYEADHVACAFARMEEAEERFDVLH